MTPSLPDDLLIEAQNETIIRRDLVQVALARQPADCVIRIGNLFDSATASWLQDAEVVIRGRRIAFVGPAGAWGGKTHQRIDRSGYSAVPGFGEVHKHIESSHLTPEYEAALVLPRGNTWTCEASHELSNVNGEGNLAFWLAAREAGSPLKIFPLPGSATPPTGYERSGGYFGAAEQAGFMSNAMVAGLDEVMDWPAVTNADNPAHDRLWGMIEATFRARGVVEGHAAGLRDLANINAFAAAGMASDHEAWTAEEAWDKLQHGLFLEIRPHSMPEIIAGLLERGLKDWSQVAFATDDRGASETLEIGATDHNLRLAIKCGLAVEKALQCVTLNPARHMRITPWVGTIAPGRFADLVFLKDVETVEIDEVWADGAPVSKGTAYTGAIPKIDWPAWAKTSVRLPRNIEAADFVIPAEPNRSRMTAAVLRPFHWQDDFLTEELTVVNDAVQRDPDRAITKMAILDRHSGEGRIAKMFWRGCGPQTNDSAVGCTVGHDSHNLWITGSSDAAMALVANQIRDQQGGWALASGGEIRATVCYEIGGLMTARCAEDLDAEWRTFLTTAKELEWHYEPSSSPRWGPGFPERLQFATLTCAPWRWVLVPPNPLAPTGLVNVVTGESHPVVW